MGIANWLKPNKAENDFSIFAVSDDLNTSPLIQNILKENGYTVHSVGSAEEVLSLLDETGLPNMFIGDFTKPQIDGKEFLEKAQIRFGRSALPPMLFLMDSPEDATTANALGVHDLLPKPKEE